MAARAAERRKALVVMKVGRSENARRATLAHTGSLAGTPEIIEATLRQSGIVQVFSLNEMIETVALLAGAVDYHGPWRTAVCTGSGGECGHVADAAAHVGIDLPPLSSASIERLKGFMPEFGNPATRSTAPARCTRTRRCIRSSSTRCCTRTRSTSWR